MHELALMESLVESVVERVGDARVTTVRLEVGRLTCVVPEALSFCFDVCASGTRLEGAAIEILEVEGRGRCRACGRELAVEPLGALCACGSADVEVLAGGELRLREVEVI